MRFVFLLLLLSGCAEWRCNCITKQIVCTNSNQLIDASACDADKFQSAKLRCAQVCETPTPERKP